MVENTINQSGDDNAQKQHNNFKVPKRLGLLLNTAYPPIEWLVDKIIPAKSVVIMSAAPASFKTWFAAYVSIKIASGESVLDRFSTRQTGVLILDEESGEQQLQRDFSILGADMDLPIYEISYACRTLNDSYVEFLIEACKLDKIQLVVFDSLTRFHDADENSASEMSKVFRQFSKFKQAGITCLVIHHNRKVGVNYSGGSAESMRGSSDILAACDVHMAISRAGNTVTITQTKNRLAEELKPFKAEFVASDDGDIKHMTFKFVSFKEGKQDKEAILKNAIVQVITDNPGFNKSQILALLQQQPDVAIAQKQFYTLLDELIQNKLILTKRGPSNAALLYANDDRELNSDGGLA